MELTDILSNLEIELYNIAKECFHIKTGVVGEDEQKTQKNEAKVDFLNKVTSRVVCFLERGNLEISKDSLFFLEPYDNLKFAQLRDEFKQLYSHEYIPNVHEIPRSVYLCRQFMNVLKKLVKDSMLTHNIKSLSFAIAELFLSINTFVLYHTAKEYTNEFRPQIQQNGKNGPVKKLNIQLCFNTRIIEKLVPLVYQKFKNEAFKAACQKSDELRLHLIEYAELRRTSIENLFSWEVLDKIIERKEFSAIANIHFLRDCDKIYFYESPTAIQFSNVTIPLVSQHPIEEKQTNELTISAHKFYLQIGTINHVEYIFDVLYVSECDIGLSKMTWRERIEFFKRTFKVKDDAYGQYKIIEPEFIDMGQLAPKLKHKQKFYVIKSLGFGMYRSFYSTPKPIKRPSDEAPQTNADPATADTQKKIRF